MSLNIGVLVFKDIELLDLAGPHEVFTVANRVCQRAAPSGNAPFSVFTVSQTTQPVKTRSGLIVQPDYSFDRHPNIDVLLVPGGVVEPEMQSGSTIAWISRTSAAAHITATICTGALLAAQAGLLDHKSATTHWEDVAELRARFPAVHVIEQQRWVDEGNMVTSAGISAGIDMSLHLVERLINREAALDTAQQMDFHWQEPD